MAMVDPTTSITKSPLYPRRRTKDRPMDMRTIRLLVLPLERLYLRWIAVREAADITFSMSMSPTLTYIKAVTFIRRMLGPKHYQLQMVSNLVASRETSSLGFRLTGQFIDMSIPQPRLHPISSDTILYPRTDTIIVIFSAAIHLACKHNVFQRQGNIGADSLLQVIG